MTIQDITMKNFRGVTSKTHDPIAGSLVCSAPDVSQPLYSDEETVERRLTIDTEMQQYPRGKYQSPGPQRTTAGICLLECQQQVAGRHLRHAEFLVEYKWPWLNDENRSMRMKFGLV